MVTVVISSIRARLNGTMRRNGRPEGESKGITHSNTHKTLGTAGDPELPKVKPAEAIPDELRGTGTINAPGDVVVVPKHETKRGVGD